MIWNAAGVLRAAGMDPAARRVERCQGSKEGRGDVLVLTCAGHAGAGKHVRVIPVRCQHRLCIVCSPKRSHKLVKQYEAGVLTFRRPVLLTFTVRNIAEEPATRDRARRGLYREDLLAMKKAFLALRRRVIWKGHECRAACRRCPERAQHGACPACGCVGRRNHECNASCRDCERQGQHGMWFASGCRRCKCPGAHPGIRGGVMALEVTASAERGWHPHLHVLCDFTRPISVWALGAAWREVATAHGFEAGKFPADVRAIREGYTCRDDRGKLRKAATREQALKYVLKYAAKGNAIPEELAPWYALAIRGVRLVQPFGDLRAKPLHTPGILPVCEECVIAGHPSEAAIPAEFEALMPRGELAEPDAPVKLRDVDKVRTVLKALADEWESIGALFPRKRAGKLLAIRRYLERLGVPLTTWRSEGLYSSIMARINSGRVSDISVEVLAFVGVESAPPRNVETRTKEGGETCDDTLSDLPW